MTDLQELRIHLPYPLYDSHFHALHMEERGFDIRELLSRLFESGLSGGMEVAVDEYDFDKRISFKTNDLNFNLIDKGFEIGQNSLGTDADCH